MNKQLTLAEYNESIIRPVVERFARVQIAEDLMRQDFLADMLAMGYTPPARWQRVKFWFTDKRQRAKDIWTILTGGDVHENCEY